MRATDDESLLERGWSGDDIWGNGRRKRGTRAFLLDADARYSMNTKGEFFYPDRHLKIDNTALEPGVVARRVVEHFGLPTDIAT